MRISPHMRNFPAFLPFIYEHTIYQYCHFLDSQKQTFKCHFSPTYSTETIRTILDSQSEGLQDPNEPKWTIWPKWAQMVPNEPKWTQIDPNC